MKSITKAAVALGALLAVSGSAFAADIDMADPAYNWTGFYVGAQAGWSWLDPNRVGTGCIGGGTCLQPSSNGVAGGIYAGVNWQISNLVLGIEADGNLTDLGRTISCANPAFRCNASSDWNASFRGRIGFAMDRFMVFGTGGYAIADYEGYTRNAAGTKFRDSANLDGWALGAGIEYAWTDNLLVRAEYRHLDFGKETMQYDIGYRVEPNIDMVTVGLAWKF